MEEAAAAAAAADRSVTYLGEQEQGGEARRESDRQWYGLVRGNWESEHEGREKEEGKGIALRCAVVAFLPSFLGKKGKDKEKEKEKEKEDETSRAEQQPRSTRRSSFVGMGMRCHCHCHCHCHCRPRSAWAGMGRPSRTLLPTRGRTCSLDASSASQYECMHVICDDLPSAHSALTLASDLVTF